MTEHKHNRKLLLLLFLGVLMGALDISIVGPAKLEINKTINIEQRLLGWILSIYVLFNLVGIPLFSKLSDNFGRRIIYIIAISIFAAGSLVVSISDNFTVLLIGRSVQGFGASGIFPVASAVVGDVYPPERRGRILGLIGAVFGIAFIIGPILAGTMLLFFKWNVLFLINLPLAALIIAGSIKILPNKRIESTSELDWKGILLLGLTLGLFAYGINQANPHMFYKSIISPSVYPFILTSFVLLYFFIMIERKAEMPVVRIKIFLRRQIRIVTLISFITGFLQASFIFIPDYAVSSFSISTSRASFMLIPVVLATAICSPLFGRLIDRIGSRIVILIGLALSWAGFLLMYFSYQNHFLFYSSGVLIGSGMAVLGGSSLRYIMLNEVGAHDRASAQGLVTVFISIGQMIGGALIGELISSKKGYEGFRFLFMHLSVIILATTIFSLRLKSFSQERATISNE